ncbi:MAG: methyltransferase domain-containing protein [Candidatus Ozemobacteraceae bacterium]
MAGIHLNLGCGKFPVSDSINVDISPASKADILADLSVFPYPFRTSSVERIFTSHMLEHLTDPFKAMAEFHRILVPDGSLVVRVPHFSRGFTHPDHKRGFDVTFPSYFDPNFQGGYSGTPFALKHMQLRWFAQPELKRTVLSGAQFRIAVICGSLIDALANLSPWVCSRWWAFFVGGFEEMEFHFVCRK